jgi:ABC-type branched-subunit amino acid transport system permease subunit
VTDTKTDRESGGPAGVPAGPAGPGRQPPWLGRTLLAPRVLGVFSGGRGNWRGTVTGLAFLAIAGAFAVSGNLTQAMLNYAAVAVIYAIVVAGIAFLYAYGGLLSVVHGSLFGIGAYFIAVLCEQHGWNLVPAMLLGMVSVAISAALFSALSVRLQGSYFVIVLFAASQVIEGIMINWTAVTGGNEGIVIATQATLFGYPVDTNLDWYRVGLITLLIVLAITQIATVSRLGRQMRAIRDNRDLAISVGISVGRTHMYAFALSGVWAGMAGAYWAFLQGYVVPSQYAPNAGIAFLVIMLLGGSAYLLGPVIGAIIVIFLPTVLHLSPLLSNAVIGVVFILVILSSPQGIAGMLVNAFRRLVNRSGSRARETAEEEAEIEPNVDLSDSPVGAR